MPVISVVAGWSARSTKYYKLSLFLFWPSNKTKLNCSKPWFCDFLFGQKVLYGLEGAWLCGLAFNARSSKKYKYTKEFWF